MENTLRKIPFLRTAYRINRETLHGLIHAEVSNQFSHVVLVPFPKKDMQAIGLVTLRQSVHVDHSSPQYLTSIFVPSAPNSTSGFLLFYQPGDVTLLDMTVEDALKFDISCGVADVPFKKPN